MDWPSGEIFGICGPTSPVTRLGDPPSGETLQIAGPPPWLEGKRILLPSGVHCGPSPPSVEATVTRRSARSVGVAPCANAWVPDPAKMTPIPTILRIRIPPPEWKCHVLRSFARHPGSEGDPALVWGQD